MQNKIEFEEVMVLVNSLTFENKRVGETTVTICSAFLPNGFNVATGKSIAFDPLEFDTDKGLKYAKDDCVKNAIEKIFEFEGYLLKVTGKTSKDF